MPSPGTTVEDAPAAGAAADLPRPTRRGHPLPGSLAAWAIVGTVVAGVALRLGSASDLWLDEALSVNVAGLPVGDLLEALRHDGHPPLYYLLLHAWMEVVGDGDVAVRSLSSVLSVATLPLAWAVGSRYGDRTAATGALLLLASAPFAVRYGTEARMYALIMLLVLVGWLALLAALERPSAARLAAVSVVSGLLLLSHYWAVWLLASLVLVLAVQARRGPGEATRRARRAALMAVIAGGLLFLPWLPSFLTQARTTGTPWATPTRPVEAVTDALSEYGGGEFGEATLLGFAYLALALLGLFGRALDGRRVELDLRTRPRVRSEVAVVALTLGLGVAAAWATTSAVAARYTAVVFPVLVVAAAVGLTVLASTTARRVTLGIVVVLGLGGGVVNLVAERTQGGQMARAIAADAGPGDLVAYCPDQLGPATSRYLPEELDGVTFPAFTPPERVDWRDYAERNAAGDPAAFVRSVHERAGDRTIWLAWAGGYRTLEGKCEAVATELSRFRPHAEVVAERDDTFEHSVLYRFPARS